MRRTLVFALAGIVALSAWTVRVAEAASSPQAPAQSATDHLDRIYYPLALATGAVAGVVTINMLTYGVGTLPLTLETATAAPIISPAAAAVSRIFVITSAVVGAWIADALYPR
jgi:hypothetical protein